jgi:hypothetical protein
MSAEVGEKDEKMGQKSVTKFCAGFRPQPKTCWWMCWFLSTKVAEYFTMFHFREKACKVR